MQPVFSPIKFWREHWQKAKLFALRCLWFQSSRRNIQKRTKMSAGVTDVMILCMESRTWFTHQEILPILNFVNCGVCGRKLPHTVQKARQQNLSKNLLLHFHQFLSEPYTKLPTANPNKMQKTTAMSSRRGRNFLLHSLEESDVVFGTKGNGRNELFLKVLESHSEQYMQLSKFQKMGLIQKIIRDWKGNFYIMNPKTNDLFLAKRKDQDLSTTDPSSRKLYTSVRRMMNYVNSKVQRQPYPAPRTESASSPTVTSRPSTPGTVIPTSSLSGANSIQTKKQKPREPSFAPPQAQKKTSAIMSATDYIRKKHANLPLATASSILNSVSIASPKRSAMLVTPEPSPRAMLQRHFFPNPILVQKGNKLVVAPLSLTPASKGPTSYTSIARKTEAKTNCYSKQQHDAQAMASIATITARHKKIKKHFQPTHNNIGDLEESAILALTSLGSFMMPATLSKTN